jgi:hypothetical protein
MCQFEESTGMTVRLESKDEKHSTWRIEMCRETIMVVSFACYVLFVDVNKGDRVDLPCFPRPRGWIQSPVD